QTSGSFARTSGEPASSLRSTQITCFTLGSAAHTTETGRSEVGETALMWDRTSGDRLSRRAVEDAASKVQVSGCRPMILLEKVSKSYDSGATYAVRDISFQVPPGQLLVLLGGSGCGKTTTLKMINRLVEPTVGRIEINGRNVCDVDPVQLRRGIGYVIQGSGL